ncbi:MAG: tetratricopeptide repeat protein [Hyphomicrobiales bacterium]
MHDHETAELALRLALEEDPSDERILYNLANVLFDAERFQDAISIYQSVIAIGSQLSSMAQDNLKLAASHLRTR